MAYSVADYELASGGERKGSNRFLRRPVGTVMDSWKAREIRIRRGDKEMAGQNPGVNGQLGRFLSR